jgi:hypothetical protein
MTAVTSGTDGEAGNWNRTAHPTHLIRLLVIGLDGRVLQIPTCGHEAMDLVGDTSSSSAIHHD